MKSRLTTYTILAALLWAMILPTTVAKPKAPTRASLEQVLKHAPGDMSTRCQLIELLLQQGDTIAAEGHIALADKLQTNACVQIQKARIAYARGRYAEAAIAYAKAFTLDVIPQNETGAYRTDSLTHGAIDTRLRVAATQDKTNAYAPVGRAELAFYHGDTAAGIGFLRLALQRGDTLQRERIDSLSRTIQRATTETGTLLYTIPFERKNGVPTLSVTANGLKIKAEIDTTATRCTISGVESHFMLKNGYLTDADFMGKQNYVTATGEIHEGTIINLREVRVGDITLTNIKASVISGQRAPLLLGQTVFRRFGTLEVDNQQHIIIFRK